MFFILKKMLKNRVKSSKKRPNRSENFDYEPDDPYYANPTVNTEIKIKILRK